MPASLAVVLSVMLLFSPSAHRDAPGRHLCISSQTGKPVNLLPEIPLAMVPALPGIALGPDPRIREISSAASPSPSMAFAGERGAVRPGTFHVHLTGLIPNADEVVVYLNAERVGAGRAQGVNWVLPCKCSVIPSQGSLLRVWVFREGQGPIPLTPVAVYHAPCQECDPVPR